MKPWQAVLLRLFSRKVVLASAVLLTLVVAIATVFPWVSDADPGL